MVGPLAREDGNLAGLFFFFFFFFFLSDFR